MVDHDHELAGYTVARQGPLALLGNGGLLLQSLDLIPDLLDAAVETRPFTGDGILTTAQHSTSSQ